MTLRSGKELPEIFRRNEKPDIVAVEEEELMETEKAKDTDLTEKPTDVRPRIL